MRNFLIGLSLATIMVQAASASCLDTLVYVKTGAPGWDGTKYNPGAAGALNNVFQNCTDGAPIRVRLKFDGDTLKLGAKIVVNFRNGKITSLVGQGTNDSILTLVQNTTSPDPQVLNVMAGNATLVSNFGFASQSNNVAASTVLISADSSSISGCHFWMADNASSGTGPLLDIAANSVLVERCLFRSPPEGVGRSVAIHTGGSANRVEIRSNVFFSTGLQLAATGAVHVIANTFGGSRNEWNAIIVGTQVLTPEKNINLQHNLFAFEVDTLPPIVFSGNVASSDSITGNAWSRGKANLPLAVSASSGKAQITLNNANGASVNTPLPKGFSNYGPFSYDVKDYPLTQLRSEPTLMRKHADFGKIYRVFANSVWTGMSDIKDIPANKLYFANFTPFLAGRTWGPNIKVGSFVDQDSYETPAPLDSGARGSALKFSLYGDKTKIKLTKRSFDVNYYKTSALVPDVMYYFFSDTLAKVTVSNDSNVLKTSTKGAYIIRDYLGDDSILTVPKEVRNDPNKDIYVKLLHYRGQLQAPVQSDGAIAVVSNVPSFPINDLKLTVDTGSSFSTGAVKVSVTRGGEAIDSVWVVTATQAGQALDTASLPATGSALTFNLKITDKGTFVFYAQPVATLGGQRKTGQATPNSAAYPINAVAGDTVYVLPKAGTCPGADGKFSTAFCNMTDALADVSANKRTTIIIRPGGVPMEDVVIGGNDTIPLTIATAPVLGRYDVNRPVFRGKNGDALTITRKNVNLKGFFIELPIGSTKTGVHIKAAGCLIDGNILRAVANGAVGGTAANIEVGATADVRFLNNVVWAFTNNIQITNSASPNIRVMNNTFVEIATLNAGKGIGISMVGNSALAAIIANNFFSGISNPFDASIAGKAGALVLDHNVYTSKPDLRGITTEIALDTSTNRIGPTDIWSATYNVNLESEMTRAIDCTPLNPCTPLYAGSSSNTYNTTIATDFLGKARVNKKEVGAYEFDSPPSNVIGVLAIEPTLSGTYSRINFVVTGKTFDPAVGEADSVHVFWSTTDLSKNIDPTLSNIPNSRKKDFPISALAGGSFSDFADSITEENTPVYFYAALGRKTNSGRILGYAYSAIILSDANKDTSDCNFSHSKSACPSDGGIFVPLNPTYSNFKTRITMTEPVAKGSFKNPAFDDIPNPMIFNLNLTSPLPMITLSPDIPGLGDAGSKQMSKATISFDGTPILDGKDLFLIPTDTTGMASLVPSWSISQAGGKTTITIESSKNGEQHYAFGKLQDGLQAGTVAATDAAPPVFDFTAAKDSAVIHIPVKFKGTGFKTANPLVLISLLPAGGSISGVLSGKHHSPTVVLTTGFTTLNDSLMKDRFYKYYLRAVAAESASTVPGGHKKPFTLDTSVTAEQFASATLRESQDLSVAKGSLNELTVILPVSKSFKEPERYADTTGKTTRSLEVEYTVFDGALISRTRSFIRTSFTQADIQISEQHNFLSSSNGKPLWNLFGYPWDESSDANLSRILAQSKWDHDYRRLMHYKGSGTGAGAFDIYDGSNPDVIKFDSGQAAWSGSTGEYKPVCLSGASLDYQPFTLGLTAGQWNDFSLPFNFAMNWKDILDSSGLTETSLTAYRYDADTYPPEWKPLSEGSVAANTVGSVLKPWQGFSVKPGTSVSLKFPILDIIRSGAQTAPKLASQPNGSWNARLQAFNGTASMSLRIGKGGQEYLFGEAPDVPGQDFRVALKRITPAGEEKVSQFIQTDNGDWQGNWALQAAAAKDAKGISLRISESSRKVPIYLVETLRKTAVPLSTEASVQVSADELRTNDYHIVVGDDNYLKGVLDGLVPLHLLALSNYPNPFAGSTLIRYALPESFGKVSFELKVRDFRGRTVWEKTIKTGNSLSYVWDGRDKLNSPLRTGVYTLSLEAAAVGKSHFKANRRILKL